MNEAEIRTQAIAECLSAAEAVLANLLFARAAIGKPSDIMIGSPITSDDVLAEKVVTARCIVDSIKALTLPTGE